MRYGYYSFVVFTFSCFTILLNLNRLNVFFISQFGWLLSSNARRSISFSLNSFESVKNIRVYTKPLQTIKQILPNLKDPIEPKQQPGVIYEIPCLHCDSIYIGETGRAFRTRRKEHMRDVNPKNLARLENNDTNNKSALVIHVYSQNHHMDWNNSKILAKETDYTRERFLESFFIHSNKYAFYDRSN